MPGPGWVPPPVGVPESGCGPPPLGAPFLVPWPARLGGVLGYPPAPPADPPRPRLRQWVAVSAASETACRRAAVHGCLGGAPRVARFHLMGPACARRQDGSLAARGAPHCRSQPPGGDRSWVWANPLGVPGPGCGPTPWGCPVLGVVGPPVGAPVLVLWPHCLGGVSRHPPGTAADPQRPRLRQWVAVSAASETACRRAAVHPPACPATGGPARHRAATRSQHSHQRSLNCVLNRRGQLPGDRTIPVLGGARPVGGSVRPRRRAPRRRVRPR